MQKELYCLMLKYGFRPDHKFDQNFIINKNIIDRIIELLDIKHTETVLEIGPGTGHLTKHLLEKAKKVIAIEKDKKLIDILEKEIVDSRLEIISADFLKVDLNNLKFDKIVGLIPYSISQEIIEKIIGTKKAVLVVQKEFAEKLVACEGFENYVGTTVIAQSYSEIKYVSKIKKGSFYPVPKVDSAIIEIAPNGAKIDSTYKEFVKNLFRYSNKDLLNAIKLIIKNQPTLFSKIDAIKVPEELLKKKVKQLNIKEIKKIYSSIL
ncbi:MAG: 16S rRNA (adenine(1518)-N(6)/adenine(1519)-N(6))-dimethyltransferase RsmA [Candidatus ainarchaeum sp.]|nr:16S rRNA (adenine(1518)-N(6)/adenine(1519)-N(6))-dimethyltransferase RsmA [Candidatus ainarchaeum sp.]